MLRTGRCWQRFLARAVGSEVSSAASPGLTERHGESERVVTVLTITPSLEIAQGSENRKKVKIRVFGGWQ